MSTLKPIKRNAAIAVLSKDHHTALLLIWKIRKALKNSSEPGSITNYLIQFYEAELIPHFKNEEELLFNALESSNTLRIRAEDEHKQIHQIIAEMRTRNDRDLLEKFAATLEMHIRFEERVLFNHLQDIIPANRLSAIADALNARENSACILPDFPEQKS